MQPFCKYYLYWKTIRNKAFGKNEEIVVGSSTYVAGTSTKSELTANKENRKRVENWEKNIF